MGNPTYVERGGEQVFVPPFIAKGVQFFGFCVEADRDSLQDICDRYLNEPGNTKNFVPALKHVMFVFNKLDALHAKQSPWRERGVYKEQEAAVWMLVLDKKRLKLSWFHPYMIVDSAYAMAMGREVYGFPKCLGEFSVPDGPATPQTMCVATTVVETFGVGAPADIKTLITADAVGSPTRDPEDFQSIEALIQYVVGHLGVNASTFTGSEQPDILNDLLNVPIPMVFLKQFRDGSSGEGACFQSIETSVTAMTGFHGARAYAQDYVIRLGDFDSHPVRKDLGLPAGPIPVKVAFWAKFDFEIGPCTRISSSIAIDKKKVAILGGGVSAITTAMRLTNDKNWRSRFESITIYQLGWRLGGKGATGRGMNGTIEEHGLHVWPGFYENSFKMIQDIYESAARRPGSRLSTWEQGFAAQNFIGLNQLEEGKWEPWMFCFPTRDGTPGSGGRVRSLRECFSDILQNCRSAVEHSFVNSAWLVRMTEASALVMDPANDRRVIDLLRGVRNRLTKHLSPRSNDLKARRAALLGIMGVTIVFGLLRDGVLTQADLERLEDEDFSSWLKRHCGWRRYCALKVVWDLEKNPMVRGLYDFAFAYENGDTTRPNFSAAPALRTVFRMCLTYKGAVFYEMLAGMGDTIFAPAYEALHNRGVIVKFFHKVTNLGLSADGQNIQTISIDVQATLKEKDVYPPLIDMPGCETSQGNLPCWPNHPRYEFLNEGYELQKDAINLESFWTPWRARDEITLEAGYDFDTVVLALSIGSVPYVCSELIQASPKWREMVRRVETVSTQALQVWPKKTLPQLGWTKGSPVLDAWVQPLNTWADLTRLIDYECWPADAKPGSLAYFCGPRQGGIPPQSAHDFPAKAYAEVKETAERMLASDIGTLWPALGAGGLPPHDRRHTFYRANIDPSERYVLSLAGSAAYRLAANESGFDNLVLTGDWIKNGYNAGCVEAATWSGIQAANTILNLPLNQGVIS